MPKPTRALIFDPEFDKRPEKAQIDYLKKLCASQNEALDQMQKERNDWRGKATVMEAQLANAQQGFEQQKMILRELINKSNEDEQQSGQRIFELEDRVRALTKTVEKLNGHKH